MGKKHKKSSRRRFLLTRVACSQTRLQKLIDRRIQHRQPTVSSRIQRSTDNRGPEDQVDLAGALLEAEERRNRLRNVVVDNETGEVV